MFDDWHDRMNITMPDIVKEQRNTALWMSICTLVLGFLLGVTIAYAEAKANAVKQSCGFYDGKTGEFKWGQP